mmetsp:Transcript_17401/g.35350  ORF Transcript_17401/g.35350 Transcript_17401/m.35350 type:complete len:370 (-) Transcript_17401:89-1198(-)
MDSTGPKISSVRAASEEFLCKMMVGESQFPDALGGLFGVRPSSKISAPPFSLALIYPTIFSLLLGSMTGPISPAAVPMTSSLARFTTLSMRSSFSPTTRSTEAAMQRCPLAPKLLATTSRTVPDMSQSGRATRWFLAPPRATTRLLRERHLLATISAIGEDPTKETAVTAGFSIRALQQSAVPWTSWKTPGGNPALMMSSQTAFMVRGTFSDGLTMTQFPRTRAIGEVHMGTMKGKLKGTMEVTTPRGRRSSLQSIPRDTMRVLPWATWGSEQAYSTVSLPLATSATASVLFLPFSRTIRSASLSVCSRIRAWNLSMMAARAFIVIPDQAGKAAEAAETAESTSARLESATVPTTSLLEGSTTSKNFPD